MSFKHRLEDKHIQLIQDKSLYDYDLILRINDVGNKYTSFDIFDYKNQKIIFTYEL